MATYIAALTIKHNGKLYKPGQKIELSEKEFKDLKGSAVTAEEWELQQKPRKAAETMTRLKERAAVLEDQNASLKAEVKKLKDELKAAKKGGN